MHDENRNAIGHVAFTSNFNTKNRWYVLTSFEHLNYLVVFIYICRHCAKIQRLLLHLHFDMSYQSEDVTKAYIMMCWHCWMILIFCKLMKASEPEQDKTSSRGVRPAPLGIHRYFQIVSLCILCINKLVSLFTIFSRSLIFRFTYLLYVWFKSI